MIAYEDLKGKVVVVTGAAGGMGKAISLGLAEAGMEVSASDVAADEPEEFRNNPLVTYQTADVRSESSVRALMDAVVSRHGQLNCAVNAAAIEFELARLSDCDVADFDRMMSVNLRGTFLCMKYQILAMLANDKPSSIVNLVSTTAFKLERMQPAYGASKHGVLGLTRQAALEYTGDNIRVNGIAPGNIDTPMLRGALDRRGIAPEVAEKTMPFKRFGNTREIASAALWLCSEASSFTTGDVIGVEGGMLLR